MNSIIHIYDASQTEKDSFTAGDGISNSKIIGVIPNDFYFIRIETRNAELGSTRYQYQLKAQF